MAFLPLITCVIVDYLFVTKYVAAQNPENESVRILIKDLPKITMYFRNFDKRKQVSLHVFSRLELCTFENIKGQICRFIRPCIFVSKPLCILVYEPRQTRSHYKGTTRGHYPCTTQGHAKVG